MVSSKGKYRLMFHLDYHNNHNNDSNNNNSLQCGHEANFLNLGPFDFQVSAVDNVYEEVNEKEYCKRRQDRLEDDWIVDDGRN